MTGARRRRSGLLRQREFRLLWIGETTSSVGNSITKVALPLVAVTTLRASTLTVSVLYAAGWLPWLLFGLPAGAWVDRLRRRRLMLACDALSVLALASVPVAAWCGLLTVPQLLAVALVVGTSAVFFSTAYVAFLPSVVGRDRLVEGNSTLEGSRSAAQVVGPGAAGLLAQISGAVAGLLADAATYVLSAACLIAIGDREVAATRARPAGTLRAEIRAGLRLSYGDPYLRVFAVYGATGNLALAGWQTLEVVFLVRTVGVGSGAVGALLAVIGLGGIVGAASARAIAARLGSARAVVVCGLGATPFGLLTPLAAAGPRLALFAVGGVVVSAGITAGNVIARSFRQAYCPPEMLGRLTASARTLAYGAIPLGALLAGALGTTMGIRAAFWVMTALLVAAGAVLLAGPLRHRRRLPDRPHRTEPVGPGSVRGEVVLAADPGRPRRARPGRRRRRPGGRTGGMRAERCARSIPPPGRTEGGPVAWRARHASPDGAGALRTPRSSFEPAMAMRLDCGNIARDHTGAPPRGRRRTPAVPGVPCRRRARRGSAVAGTSGSGHGWRGHEYTVDTPMASRSRTRG